IAVYSDHIFNGSFVKAMNKAQYSSLVFTQATHLELRLVVEASKVMLQPKGTANAQAFVELVNRMLPAKTSVYVDLEQHVTDNPMLSRRVSEVLGGIFENAQDRRLMQPGMKIPIGAVPPLLAMTSLYFSQAFNWDVTSEFVKRNTATLKSLGFTYFSIKGIATLLSDHQGNNVVYPVLEDLYLGYYSSLNDCHPLIPDNVVFFPVLNKLTFRSKSPVAGYYLFKGNETTLEHLVIDSHVAVVDQLERFGIFNGETFPNLKDIEVSKNVNGFIPVESIASIPDTVYMHVRKRVDNIVPVPIPSAHLKEIVSNAQFMTTTHLHLKNTSLSLSDMVVLLDSLPRVKVVTSYFDGLGAEFSRWNVLNGVDTRLHKLEDLAVSVTALSAVCPLFSWYDARVPLHVQLDDTRMMLVRNGQI
ncbi:hypothetical protein GGH96_004753, partial [Coemansia sp. RSA 1972]